MHECNRERKEEEWYDNMTSSFCPHMSNVLENTEANGTVHINKMMMLKSLPKIWNTFVMCKIMAVHKDKGSLDPFYTPIDHVQGLYHDICIEQAFLSNMDNCTQAARSILPDQLRKQSCSNTGTEWEVMKNKYYIHGTSH